jgi:hypothetical protein
MALQIQGTETAMLYPIAVKALKCCWTSLGYFKKGIEMALGSAHRLPLGNF